jgi:hypothetical protein
MILAPIRGAPDSAPSPDFPGRQPDVAQPRPVQPVIGAHRFVGQFWDIAIVPIRDGPLAVSLCRLVDATTKTTSDDAKFVDELPGPQLRNFLAEALNRDTGGEFAALPAISCESSTKRGLNDTTPTVPGGCWGHPSNIQFATSINAGSSPMGRVMFTIIGAMAELVSTLIRERVNAGMMAAQTRGKYLGRPPISQRVVSEIEAHPQVTRDTPYPNSAAPLLELWETQPQWFGVLTTW